LVTGGAVRRTAFLGRRSRQGNAAVLVLLGDEGLDVTRLHRESRAAVDIIEAPLV
jgi:hypothetical protein